VTVSDRTMKLLEWLDPQSTDEDLSIVPYDPVYGIGTWMSTAEVRMVDPDSMSQGVLKYIENELHNLYRWQKAWDKQSKETKTKRANSGMCRMATGKSCHSWEYNEQRAHFSFINQNEQEEAVFFNLILECTAQMGLPDDYWGAAQSSCRSTILKAIRAIWKKPKCKLGVCYEHEQESDTYYIPLGVCIRDPKSLALVHWSDMMRKNPDYFVYRVPDFVSVALAYFQQRIENPWKKAIQDSIGDRDQMLAITWQSASQQEEETTMDVVGESTYHQTSGREWQSWEQQEYAPWTTSEPPWRSAWHGWQERGSSPSAPSTRFGRRTY